jgi:hypothetical protein
MPRYFFHLRCTEQEVLDPSGAERRDADEAWETARNMARDLMQQQPDAAVSWLMCHFEVVDEAGEIVFELPFSEAVDLGAKPN